MINKFAIVNFTIWFAVICIFSGSLIFKGINLTAWPAFVVLIILFTSALWVRGRKPVQLTKHSLILNRFPLQNKIPLNDIASFHLGKSGVAVVYKNGFVRQFRFLVGPVDANLKEYRFHPKFMDKS